jgi:NAD(P)-dependent dehydrogenase (short-subunit alcohol dehydrogenase family)
MSGRVVVVTGASAGVGRAAVRSFAAAGDDVAVLARGEGGLEAAAKEVEAAGRRALVVPCDVSDAAAVADAAGAVEAALGPIDVWVNNAFASVFAPFWDITVEEFERTTAVTYLGFVNGTRAALACMLPRDRGVIVHVGSALAFRGIPLQSAYCGAKHAIEGFTESVRTELLHQQSRVRITSVHCPALNTPQFSWVLARLPRQPQPVPPIYAPALAGRAIVHAADHPERRAWWLGGSTALTIAANAIAPGLLDRYLGRTGFDSQQTSDRVSTTRPANLWAPVDATDDYGADGAFADRTHTRSWQWWLTTHRRPLTTALALGALATYGRRRARG